MFEKSFEMGKNQGLGFIKGSVKVTRLGKSGREVILALLNEGDFFGEMSFVDMMPRSATVKATQDTEIWVWPYTLLREMYVTDMKCYTLLVMNIAREISRRLRRSDESKRSNSR